MKYYNFFILIPLCVIQLYAQCATMQLEEVNLRFTQIPGPFEHINDGKKMQMVITGDTLDFISDTGSIPFVIEKKVASNEGTIYFLRYQVEFYRNLSMQNLYRYIYRMIISPDGTKGEIYCIFAGGTEELVFKWTCVDPERSPEK